MSTNLNADQVAANQDQAEITINNATGRLDAALTEELLVEVDNTNAATIADEDFRAAQFIEIDEDTGTPATAAITITVGAIKKGTFVLINDTAFDVTVTISGQSEAAPVVAAGERTLLASDGTNVRAVGGGGGGSSVAAIGIFFPGAPGNSELLSRFMVPYDMDIPSGATDSQAYAGVTATAAATVDIRKNGVSIGTADFAIGNNVGTFTFASLVSFVAGDRLEFVGQGTADATLADISITMKGTQT